MIIKSIKANKTETSSTISLKDELSGLSKADKKRALNEVGEYLIEQTILSAAESKSPVKGETIPALSKEYKLKKREEVGHTKANLELSGDMLDSLDYKIVSEDDLKIGFFGKEAPKADGHNNFSGKSKLPKRRTLPGEGQKYKSSIETEVSRIIADKKSTENKISKETLKDITTKNDLFRIIGEKLGLTARSEIKLAILRNGELFGIVEELGFDEWL